jgi:hypothetical protein
MPPIQVKDVTLKELLNIAGQHSIHRLLLAEYSSVEPRQQGTSFVLAPMLKVVATAFDRENGVIYRWWEQDESERMVAIAGNGTNLAGKLTVRKDQVRDFLREDGFEVDEGEWTPESAEAFLDARKKAIG